jgi:hypothetical protein
MKQALMVILGLTLSMTGAAAQSPSSDSAEFVRQYPMALVYQGIGLYEARDYEGAIKAWEEYVGRTENPADTTGLGDLIRDAWIRQYPLSLVYEGYGRYLANDVVGAVASWERYIELAPAGEDTVAVRQMIARILIPDEVMAHVGKQVSWFVEHEVPEIMNALNGTSNLAGGTAGKPGTVTRTPRGSLASRVK